MAPAAGERWPRRGAELAAWSLALLAAAALLAARDYRARDADSRLYARISARMARDPLPRWIAPQWPPGWYADGLFRDHPAGIHLPAALLGRLGYPPEQAAYALNAAYQILTIVLAQRLAASLLGGVEGRAVGWMIQLIPIAFAFRIRANHEQAVVMCLLAALLGVERARRRPLWSALAAAGMAGLLLVKGILALFAPPLAALWLLTRRDPGGGSARGGWLAVAAGSLSLVVAAGLYELAYRAAAGEPFWSVYLARHLELAGAPGGDPWPLQKARNLLFYAGRVVWFAFPWSLTFLAAGIPARRSRGALRGSRAGGWLFAAGAALLYVGAFSLSDRLAERYVFPVYYAIAMAGSGAALARWPRLARTAARWDRWHPLPTAAVWAATFLLHMFAAPAGIPTLKF